MKTPQEFRQKLAAVIKAMPLEEQKSQEWLKALEQEDIPRRTLLEIVYVIDEHNKPNEEGDKIAKEFTDNADKRLGNQQKIIDDGFEKLDKNVTELDKEVKELEQEFGAKERVHEPVVEEIGSTAPAPVISDKWKVTGEESHESPITRLASTSDSESRRANHQSPNTAQAQHLRSQNQSTTPPVSSPPVADKTPPPAPVATPSDQNKPTATKISVDDYYK